MENISGEIDIFALQRKKKKAGLREKLKEDIPSESEKLWTSYGKDLLLQYVY